MPIELHAVRSVEPAEGASTLIVTVPVAPLAVAVTVVDPTPVAVTTPAAVIVATLGAEDCQITGDVNAAPVPYEAVS